MHGDGVWRIGLAGGARRNSISLHRRQSGRAVIAGVNDSARRRTSPGDAP